MSKGWLMSGSGRGSDFVPMAGPEAEIRELIERHLDVTAECGCGSTTVDGVDAAAVAIVNRLRELGMVW